MSQRLSLIVLLLLGVAVGAVCSALGWNRPLVQIATVISFLILVAAPLWWIGNSRASGPN